MAGSIRSLRNPRSRDKVRSSSEAASLLYPTTSAARMAASFRVSAMAALSPHARLARLLVSLDRLFRLADHCPPARNRTPSWTFKHALVQDAAYGTLLRSRRQQLHGRIAEVLEERFPGTTESQPEVLAHHCTQAGLVDQAVRYWHNAAQLALARSAAAEAIDRLSRGLEILHSLPEGPERDRQELDLQITLGSASLAAKGWGSPEMGRAYTRAYELCHTVD